jgi:hypothetical protein
VAGLRTIDDRANRATFSFSPNECGSFRERERRNIQHHRRSLPMIGMRWSRIATGA